ncbi:NUDIX domain-containing protein [Streptacidiphilus sp. EB103A]|uniref:NUDIX domain-containing protein n=1 Tax=Streptacidiphilus sp. EB103A TaxID=3156275 RepID=UPI003512A951
MTSSSPAQPCASTPTPAADVADSRTARAVLFADSAVLTVPPEQPFLRVRQANSGWAVLPGGKTESGESLRDIAWREAREETGVEVEVQDLLVLKWLSATAGPPAGREHLCFMSTFAATIRVDQFDQLSVPAGELHEHLWWTVEEAAQPGRVKPVVRRNLRAAVDAWTAGIGAVYS